MERTLTPTLTMLLSALALPGLALAAPPDVDQGTRGTLSASLHQPAPSSTLVRTAQQDQKAAAAPTEALGQVLSHGSRKDRLAAVRALGQQGEQQSRPVLARLLRDRDRSLAKAASKTLGKLDQAKGRPSFFLVLSSPVQSASLDDERRLELDHQIRDRVDQSRALVLSGGEDQVLGKQALRSLLRQRRLTGLRAIPNLIHLTHTTADGRTVASCRVDLALTTLERQQWLFSSCGEARAVRDGQDLSQTERTDLERQALQAAARAAAEDIAGYLEQKASGPRLALLEQRFR